MWSLITEIFSETGITLPLILFCGVCGILVAVCVSIFNNEVLGRLVKKMLHCNAVGIENAKTLPELGFSEKGISYFCLKNGFSAKKTVFSVKSEEDGGKTTVRYYISEDNISRASSLYKTNKSSPIVLVVAVILLIATAVIMYKIIPDLIQMASNLVNKTQE